MQSFQESGHDKVKDNIEKHCPPQVFLYWLFQVEHIYLLFI